MTRTPRVQATTPNPGCSTSRELSRIRRSRVPGAGHQGRRAMGRRRMHSPEEVVAKLRQVEVLVAQGKPVSEAVRAIAVSEATYFRWRAEFGGLKLDQVKRLRELERENARLRKAVADLTLEKVVLKEAASGNW